LPSGDMTLVSSVISRPVPESNMVTIDLGNTIHATSWISVAILPLCIFLLISYAVLPVKWTHRHYLSVCFTLGICCMEASWMLACAADLIANSNLARLHHPPRRQTRPMPQCNHPQ
jgi:hypothetical protein